MATIACRPQCANCWTFPSNYPLLFHDGTHFIYIYIQFIVASIFSSYAFSVTVCTYLFLHSSLRSPMLRNNFASLIFHEISNFKFVVHLWNYWIVINYMSEMKLMPVLKFYCRCFIREMMTPLHESPNIKHDSCYIRKYFAHMIWKLTFCK